MLFELIKWTGLDLGHNKTSSSSELTVQYPRTVGLGINLASYGRLEVLMLRACGDDSVGFSGQPVHSLFLM